ncbi:hypothetical protein BAE44_0013503, partial [Dichanthelium oligosanthes]
LPKHTRRLKAAVQMYTAWNLWKERNRRTFEGQAKQLMQVANEIKEEMAVRRRACGSPALVFNQ